MYVVLFNICYLRADVIVGWEKRDSISIFIREKKAAMLLECMKNNM